MKYLKRIHCFQQSFTAGKVPKYGVISGPYFPVFGLNTERYGVSLLIQFEYRRIWTRNNSVFGLSLRIQFKYRKIWSRNNSVFGHFSSSAYLSVFSPNTGKYGPEITLYLNTCHIVSNYKKKNACYES